jgi:membrane-bound lytic murein transglycosylase D
MLFGLILSTVILAAAPAPVQETFPVPTGFEGRVQFWAEAFGVYDESKAVIYDERDPRLVYVVVDRRTGAKLPVGLLGDRAIQFLPAIGSARLEISSRYEALARVNLSRDRKTLDDVDRRLLEPFGGLSARPETLRQAAAAVRAQVGAKSRVAAAIERMSPYRAVMEGALIEENTPPDLIGLPIVETMFDVTAVSPCGAAGPWQFMPLTAKGSLKMSSLLDERRDVEMATHAAARLLRTDRQSLGNWALAVTAYNSGRSRVAKVVAAAGTNNIALMVTLGDQVRGFGVASRNYYAEFLAARAVLESRPAADMIPWDVDTVTPGRDVEAGRLWESCGLDVDVVATLNPALSREGLRTGFILPAGVAVHVPRADAERVRTCLMANNATPVETVAKAATDPTSALIQ